VGVRPLLLLARLLVLTLEDPAQDAQTFVFLGHSEKATVDERLLLDAVAIYTRDLGIALVQGPDKQPAQVSPPVLDDLMALLKARGARLAFWCQAGPGGRQIELITVDARRNVGRYLFDPDASSKPDVYRAIALKLRATLIAAEGSEPLAGSAIPGARGSKGAPATASVATPAGPAAGQLGTGTPPSTSSSQAAAGVGATPTGTSTGTARRAPADAGRADEPSAQSGDATLEKQRAVGADGPSSIGRWVFFGGGYALSFPIDAAGGPTARNALALQIVAKVGPSIEFALGSDIALSAERTKSAATVSVLDVPVRLGGRRMHRIGPFSVGAGAFAGVHWLSAKATAPGMTDQRSAFAASGGLELLARGPTFHGFAGELRGWAEANAPRTRFVVAGTPNFDAGPVRVGLNVGIVAPVN
jgi:hypothetical protein